MPKAQALQRGGARDGGATGGFHRVLQLRWVPGAGRWMARNEAHNGGRLYRKIMWENMEKYRENA